MADLQTALCSSGFLKPALMCSRNLSPTDGLLRRSLVEWRRLTLVLLQSGKLRILCTQMVYSYSVY